MKDAELKVSLANTNFLLIKPLGAQGQVGTDLGGLIPRIFMNGSLLLPFLYSTINHNN